MADKKAIIEKFKKQGVKFNKAGKPMDMEKIYNTNPELHKKLIDNFYSTAGTMDEGKIDLKAMMKKVKEKMKGKRKLQSGDDLIKETEKRIKNNGR